MTHEALIHAHCGKSGKSFRDEDDSADTRSCQTNVPEVHRMNSSPTQRREDKGFTLIELMVVVLIIAIL
ncbi:MAG: type IV pilin protein, partial [Ilumatobacteraceae bacterium]